MQLRILVSMSLYFAVIIVLLHRVVSSQDIDHTTCETYNIFEIAMYSQRDQDAKWRTSVHVEKGYLRKDTTNDTELYLQVQQLVVICNCATEVLQVYAHLTVPPPQPDEAYQFLPDLGYYKLHTSPQTWQQASNVCTSEGAYLIILNSDTEAQAMHGLVKKVITHNSSYIFSGFYRHSPEDQFLTVHGENVHLKIAQKNTKAIEDANCGAINAAAELNSVPCNWQFAFICEHNVKNL